MERLAPSSSTAVRDVSSPALAFRANDSDFKDRETGCRLVVVGKIMRQIPFTSILTLLLPLSCTAYCKNVASRNPGLFAEKPNGREPTSISSTTHSINDADRCPTNDFSSRRRALFHAVVASPSAWVLPTVASATDVGTSPARPVAILGAGGGTGIEVAQTLAKEGLYTVTMTRTGRDPLHDFKLRPEVQAFIEHYPDAVSVVQKESLKEALTKVQASAIVFCASASKQGGTAFEVDDQGVGNAAEVARDLNARFILVSALAVDRPNSKSYQITNALGGHLDRIMDAKLQGENKVRSILSKNKDYIIIRPGVLMRGRTKNGPLDLEVNQDDKIGGGLSRDELAGVVVGALVSGKRGVTVEVYRRSTAMPLQSSFTIPSGREAQSNTYVGLFHSTEPDQ